MKNRGKLKKKKLCLTLSGHSNTDAFLVTTVSAIISVPWVDCALFLTFAKVTLIFN